MKKPKTPSQRGKAARLRGQRHEQKIVNLFKEIYHDAARHLESQRHEAQKKVDIYAGPFAIQCKHEQKYVPAQTIFETPQEEGKMVLMVTGGEGATLPDLVIVRFADLDKFEPLHAPHHTIANPGTYPSLNRALAELKGLKNAWSLPVLGLANGKEDVVLCAMLLPDFLEVCKNKEKENGMVNQKTGD